ncbi:DegV family protein, partial [Staphylococcus saprophyticus]|uniref:DegV family protein n=1 Tax=Staphylococcus saprophyticus TaxID=29385 RepID=UPI0037047B33
MPTNQFYQRINTSTTIPTTTQPPIPHFLHNFHQLPQQPYTHLISLFLSSPITPSYQTPTQAGQILSHINLHTFHSNLPPMVQPPYVLKPIQIIQQAYHPKPIIQPLHPIP